MDSSTQAVSRLLSLTVVAVVMFTAVVGIASGHTWQETVEEDGYQLGINSDPERPTAGLETTFVAAVSEAGSSDHSGESMTNRSVTIDIVGPDGSHKHMTTRIPADDPHFEFVHTFLTNGTHEVTVTTTVDGESRSFTTSREVQLLPTSAGGSEVTELRTEMQSLQQQLQLTQLFAGVAALFAVLSTCVSLYAQLRRNR